MPNVVHPPNFTLLHRRCPLVRPNVEPGCDREEPGLAHAKVEAIRALHHMLEELPFGTMLEAHALGDLLRGIVPE